jgi:putative endonuclease
MMSSVSGVLYIGVTSDLMRRVWEHRQGFVKGFTKKYHVKKLVYYETTGYVHSAIEREKQIKKWRREKKVALIEEMNPTWKDLYDEL